MLKDAPPEELLAAIEIIAGGDALIAPAVTRWVIEEFVRRSPPPPPPQPTLNELTDREREVLELLARGLSNAEIGQQLVVSSGTVKTHVAHVLSKLGLRDRIQAVILAYETGLVEPRRPSGPIQPHCRGEPEPTGPPISDAVIGVAAASVFAGFRGSASTSRIFLPLC
jgi:DNA-binding CsgD family transcriptional regulator